MAQKILWVDDLDNDVEADRTVPFSFNGKDYTIDLSEDNFQAMKSDLAKWIEHASKAGSSTAKKPAPQRAQRQYRLGEVTEPQPQLDVRWWPTPTGVNQATKDRFTELRQEVRAWAKDNGWPDLGDAGRIPDAAYDAWVRHVYYKGGTAGKDAS